MEDSITIDGGVPFDTQAGKHKLTREKRECRAINRVFLFRMLPRPRPRIVHRGFNLHVNERWTLAIVRARKIIYVHPCNLQTVCLCSCHFRYCGVNIVAFRSSFRVQLIRPNTRVSRSCKILSFRVNEHRELEEFPVHATFL